MPSWRGSFLASRETFRWTLVRPSPTPPGGRAFIILPIPGVCWHVLICVLFSHVRMLP